jgi:hypothetical protein
MHGSARAAVGRIVVLTALADLVGLVGLVGLVDLVDLTDLADLADLVGHRALRPLVRRRLEHWLDWRVEHSFGWVADHIVLDLDQFVRMALGPQVG